MNLLIVDDQTKVVQGLLNSVEWKKYGIDQTFGALSVSSALEIFERNTIDVLLCDIEMPIENGLSLVAWVNKQALDTRCILLTAHAEFSYAQESVRLHVFDYILQPESYENIALTVQRAVQDLQASREEQILTSLGKEFAGQEEAMLHNILYAWLNGQGSQQEINVYADLGKLPDRRHYIMLSLLQILRWTKLGNWTPELLTVAFGNIVEELFRPYGQRSLVIPVGEKEFAILLWSEQNNLSSGAMEQQLSILASACQKYFNCIVALYQCGHLTFDGLAEGWGRLRAAKADNVARRDSIFVLQQEEEVRSATFVPQIDLWVQELKSDHPEAMKQSANSYLDELSAAGRLDARTLRIFYQDFLQAVHNALGTDHTFWHEALTKSQNFQIYCNATNSVEQMKALVDLVVKYFAEHTAAPEQGLLDKINSFIDSHMEEDIHRQNIADYVFLNADYLNRLVRQASGLSIQEYVSQRKLNRAKALLLTTRLPISIVAAKVGYGNASHFSAAYKKQFGQTPMQTRHEGLQKKP